jgi:hypothetical protein
MTVADRLREGARELAEYGRTFNQDGMFVRGRCFAARRGDELRYEILIDGFGQYAVVDVMQKHEIPSRMEQAMEGFAAAAMLRGGTRSFVLK